VDRFLKALYNKDAVTYSLVWLGIYLVLNTITGNIAGAMDLDMNLVGAVPNLALTIICYCSMKEAGIAEEIGLLTKPAERAPVMLYYLPLLALPFISLAYGIKTSLSVVDIAILLAMYTSVGFMEEIIFRGLMFKGLVRKWNRYVVVAFISFTFAIGHIVSMVAVAQSGTDTVLQILNSFVVGFMFMAVMLASRNLTICVVAHILYNFLANISLVGRTTLTMVLVNTVITVLYFVYLLFRSKNVKAYFAGADIRRPSAA
jgi:uncharacterized protein